MLSINANHANEEELTTRGFPPQTHFRYLP